MEQRLNLVTLGVHDLDRMRTFYVDGLGWPLALDVPGEVCFIQLGHGLLLGLFGAAALDSDIGRPSTPTGAPMPLSLARVVDTEDQVRDMLRTAAAAGGTVLKDPQLAEFGGFHGYFADPDGFVWEIATNPGLSVSADGTVTIRAIV
jgi:catechol 2,3-dioxygenase-like lactoylglutathione lyase family enzyme